MENVKSYKVGIVVRQERFESRKLCGLGMRCMRCGLMKKIIFTLGRRRGETGMTCLISTRRPISSP